MSPRIPSKSPFPASLQPCWLVAALIACLSLSSCRTPAPDTPAASSPNTEPVGLSDSNRIVLPVSQILTPAGKQLELPGLRPQALALSPDGRILVTSGKTHELVVVDPDTGDVRQRVPLPSEKAGQPPADVVSTHILEPDKQGQLSYTGLIFSPDGTRIYLANVNGSIKVFAVAPNLDVTPLYSIPLPQTGLPLRQNEIPSGLALSPDATRL